MLTPICRVSGIIRSWPVADLGKTTHGIKGGVSFPPFNNPCSATTFVAFCVTNAEFSAPKGPVVRIAPNHLSFNSHAAQKVIYGFGTRTVPSMVKDPIFFTPEVDHSMNIINETDREEHSRMRRMLSFAFSNSNLLENEDVLMRRTNDFIGQIGRLQSPDGKRGINIVHQFNYVTFNIMGKLLSPTENSSTVILAKALKLQGKCRSAIHSMRGSRNNRVRHAPPQQNIRVNDGIRIQVSLGRCHCQHHLHERCDESGLCDTRLVLIPGVVQDRPHEEDSLQTCGIRDRAYRSVSHLIDM